MRVHSSEGLCRDSQRCLHLALEVFLTPGLPHLWPPELSTVVCSARCQWDQIRLQQPVCHMTGAKRCLLLYFRVRRGCTEWLFTTAVYLPLTPPNCVASRGDTRTVTGPELPQDHADTGEIGGGQFHGRDDGWWLQRRPSRWLGSAAEVSVQQTGVSRAVSGWDRVLGGSCREADPDPEGDQAAAVVHRLCRVSNLCASIFSCNSILFGSEHVLPGPLRSSARRRF